MFANQLNQHGSQIDNIPEPKTLSLKSLQKMESRLVLLEHTESAEFDKKAHLLGVVEGMGENEDQWQVQAHNLSGDPEGKAECEVASDLWLLPQPGEIVEVGEGKSIRIISYNLASSTVHLEPIVNKKKQPATPKKQPSKKDAERLKKKKNAGRRSCCRDKAAQPAQTQAVRRFPKKAVRRHPKKRGVRNPPKRARHPKHI